MHTTSLIHQCVLFAHLIAFAIALSTVLREDLALLAGGAIDLQRLARTARTLTLALAALWLTGLGLAAFGLEADALALHIGPKLAAKLVVVSALTANGLALHALAFPRLARPALPDGSSGGSELTVPVLLGAVSTASWLYASFIGASRLIAPWMRFADYMALYAVLLAGAAAVSIVVVRPRMARLFDAGQVEAHRTSPEC